MPAEMTLMVDHGIAAVSVLREKHRLTDGDVAQYLTIIAQIGYGLDVWHDDLPGAIHIEQVNVR